MSIEGSLADFRLPEILQAVAQQRRTGILTVQSETTIVAVSFLSGGVVAADSLAHTLEERLADALVAAGDVDRATVTDLMRRQDAGEGRLVDLLVADDLLSRDEVLVALRRQNELLLDELLAWDEGEFKFYGGDEVAYEEGIAPIVVEDLLLAALSEGAGAEGEGFGEPAAGGGELGGWEPEAGEWAEPQDEDEEEVAGGWDGEPSPGEIEPAPVPLEAPPRPVGPAPPASRAAAAAAVPLSSDWEPEEVVTPRRGRSRAADRDLVEDAGHGGRAVPALLGLLLAATLVAAAVALPVRLLLPFPWHEGERRALGEVQRLADRLAVDRAAKTFFLLEGHFPQSLEELVALGLLDEEDRVGPDGERLLLVAREESYDLLAEGGIEPLWSEAINGNFLLDPELRAAAGAPRASDQPPLVLLD